MNVILEILITYLIRILFSIFIIEQVVIFKTKSIFMTC